MPELLFRSPTIVALLLALGPHNAVGIQSGAQCVGHTKHQARQRIGINIGSCGIRDPESPDLSFECLGLMFPHVLPIGFEHDGAEQTLTRESKLLPLNRSRKAPRRNTSRPASSSLVLVVGARRRGACQHTTRFWSVSAVVAKLEGIRCFVEGVRLRYVGAAKDLRAVHEHYEVPAEPDPVHGHLGRHGAAPVIEVECKLPVRIFRLAYYCFCPSRPKR